MQFELMDDARASLRAWSDRRRGSLDDYVFSSRIDHTTHYMSTQQYARLADEWVTGVGLRREEYGTHSLRRTRVQIPLGHTKIENTIRYLGVEVEDALTLAERTEI